MAGIVAAETDNGAGVAGIGFSGVRVMPVTVLGADGTGQDSDIIEGVVYAADHDADVILMSFSNPGYSELLQAAVDYAWENGVVLVAATGNDGSSAPQFPAGDRGVIGVSNTDQSDALNGSSNYGQDVFLGAPGTSIATTSAGGGYTAITGTSASAAEVAGAAALIKANSGAANGVIVSRLAKNAEAVGTRDQTGNGRLNLDRAVTDTSTGSVQPAGAAPIGGGGPFVGPYVAAANNFTASPLTQSVAAGSTDNDFTWTFTATNSGNEATSTFTIHADWPAPQSTNSSGANYVSVSGTCDGPFAIGIGPLARVITITQSGTAGGSGRCASGETLIVNYLNVTAPTPSTPPQTYTFDFDDNAVGADPTVTVTAPVIRSTSTSVTCVPSSVALNQGSVCTATVTERPRARSQPRPDR